MDDLEQRLLSIDEQAMYEAPASTRAAIVKAADRLRAYREALEAIIEAYDDASNYDMLTAQLEYEVDRAREALRVVP